MLSHQDNTVRPEGNREQSIPQSESWNCAQWSRGAEGHRPVIKTTSGCSPHRFTSSGIRHSREDRGKAKLHLRVLMTSCLLPA